MNANILTRFTTHFDDPLIMRLNITLLHKFLNQRLKFESTFRIILGFGFDEHQNNFPSYVILKLY